jgi:bacteriocin-like protein
MDREQLRELTDKELDLVSGGGPTGPKTYSQNNNCQGNDNDQGGCKVPPPPKPC